MALQFSFEYDGVTQLNRSLSRLGDDVTDFRPVWEDIDELLRAITEEQFDTEGQGEWEPLSPTYAAWKAVHYPGKSMLRREDRLIDSLTRETGDSVREFEALQMKWGTKVPYAQYHQQGRGVPQRRVVDLTEDDKLAIMKELQRFVVAKAREVHGVPSW
mgnify:CR=1 FL=1